jgi:hypothetical protein
MHNLEEISSDQKIENWKQCDVLYLANHFHMLESKSKQFIRLDSVHLDSTDIERLFIGKAEIQSIDISFGLSELVSPTHKLTFAPIIKIQFIDSINQEVAEFKPVMPKNEPGLADAKVPYPFKEALSKNWMELDTNLLDDIFMSRVKAGSKNAQDPNAKNASQPFFNVQRLHGYHFCCSKNEELFKYVNTNRHILVQFIMYLGVDLNKFGDPYEFSFSPIFGLVFSSAPSEPQGLAKTLTVRSAKEITERLGREEVTSTTVYFEYMKPCPSTCDESESEGIL